jgi:hypothetical protein
MRTYKGVRYTTLDEVPAKPLMLQGTIYDTPEQAKYAAAKLFCNVRGVIVKQVKSGWTLFWWR